MKPARLLLALSLCCSWSCAQGEAEPVPLDDVGGRPITWAQVDAVPDWVERPVRQQGFFAFATVRRGSNQPIAQARATRLCDGDVQRVLCEHLTPVLGREPSAKVVASLLPHVVLVAAATEPTRRIPGARGPGQTVGAAYLRWRLPIRAALAEVDPELQGRVEWILLRDVVRWQELEAEPAWFAKPPSRGGYVRVALATLGELPRKTREHALTNVRSRVHRRLLERLAPAIGFRLATAAADRGIDRIAPVQRADWLRRPFPLDGSGHDSRVTTVWGLWEVPVAGMLEAVPVEYRDRAEATLRPSQPAEQRKAR